MIRTFVMKELIYATGLILYPLKTIRKLELFLCFQGTYKETSNMKWINVTSSRPNVFLGKGALKICSKFTGEHPCRSVISIELLCNFIEITPRYGCSLVKLLRIFRTPFF